MWWPVVCILINAIGERKPVIGLNAQFFTRMTGKRRGPALLTALRKARRGRSRAAFFASRTALAKYAIASYI